MAKKADKTSGDIMTSLGGNAKAQLKSLVERIEHLNEEIEGLTEDRKEIYTEAKGNGFDAKIIRKVVALRKREKADIEAENAMIDLYYGATGRGSIFG
jgi:uncharacterized protein (UPF0335 family)